MPFIHELADVQSDRIGANTRIGQFVVVQPGASIGDNCNAYVQAFAEIGVLIRPNAPFISANYIRDYTRGRHVLGVEA